MTSRLRASAPEFRPASSPVSIPEFLPEDPFGLNNDTELSVSPDELAELQTADSWVEMMASMEEQEQNHLIALGLRYADRQKLMELKARAAGSAMAPPSNGWIGASSRVS